MNDPYVLSIVAKGYRLRFTSPPLLRQTPWEIRSPQDPQEILGMHEQITLMLQKNAITEVPPDSPVLLERIPGKKGFGRVASSHRSKESERTHSRTSFPYVHDKLCSKLRRKRRLRVQDRSAGCVLSCTDSSKQQEIPQVRLRKQGVPVSITTFWSKYSPSSFYSFGAHSDSIHAPSGGFGDTISGRLASSPPGPSNHHPDRQILLRHQALLIDTLDLVGFILNRKKSELDLTQDLQFLGIHLRLDLGRALLPESKAGEIVACARHLSSLKVLNYSQVSHLMGSLNWASGLIPLGRLYLRPLQRHFHSLGLTNRFTAFQADYTIFTDASNQGWGAHMGHSKISGTWTLIDRKLHINCLELKAVTCALQHWLLCFRATRSWSPLTIRQWFHISTSREGHAPLPCYA